VVAEVGVGVEVLVDVAVAVGDEAGIGVFVAAEVAGVGVFVAPVPTGVGVFVASVTTGVGVSVAAEGCVGVLVGATSVGSAWARAVPTGVPGPP
jgi:hypothetical protein